MDDLIRSVPRRGQACLLHQFEGMVDIMQSLLVSFWFQMEGVERHEESLERPHQQDEADTVGEVSLEVGDGAAEAGEVRVAELDE